MLDIVPIIAQQAAEVAHQATAWGSGLPLAGGFAGAGIGIGIVGGGAAQAVGRNPGAFGKVLTISMIGMALAEAIAIYALVVFFIWKS